jgi:MFS family permease
LLSLAIVMMGNGLQNVLLPIRANLEAFPTPVIGLLASVYYAGFMGGCLLVPWVVRRVGHIRAFAAFCAIASATALIHALVVDSMAWAALRLFSGFCFAGIYVVVESWMNERADNTNRGRLLSVYRIVDLGALSVGQLLLPLADPMAFTLFSAIAILVSLGLVPICMTSASAPGPIVTVRLRLWRLYGVSPLGVVGAFGTGLANGALWGLGMIFASRLGMELDFVAYFMALTVVGGVILQWPIGRLSDHIDRRTVLAFTAVVASLAGVVLAIFGAGSELLALGVGCLYGGLSMPLYSLAISHANDFLDEGDFVETSSGLMFCFSTGAVIGPLLAAPLIDVIGPGGLFVFTATTHAVLAAFAFYRMTQRPAFPVEEQDPFRSVPIMTALILDLDPRAPDMEDSAPEDGAGPVIDTTVIESRSG